MRSETAAPCTPFGRRFCLGDVDLWLIDLDDPVHQASAALLSAPERERLARLVFAHDRRRMQAAHGMLRRVLGEAAGVPPQQLQLARRENGKPWWPGQPGLFFNLSHSRQWGLIACGGRAELGVDLELRERQPDVPGLAARVFTRAEQRELASEEEDGARNLRFLRGWTRKEACLKATGWGLAVDPSTVETGTGGEDREVRLSRAGQQARVRVTSLALGPGMVAALAIQC